MNRKPLNNIVEIIKTDLKATLSNPIVTIVLIAIIILPSLYALLNIQACWDPYGNTGNVEFAIANLDQGAYVEGDHINVGNELVTELKNNTKFKWKFVSEKELREGVFKGRYYAGIVLPRNLSENVASIVSDHPKQADLEYVVNIKSSPVGTKLTDSAANSVYTSLNAKIVQFINLAAYGKLGELQEGLAAGASQLASGGGQLQSGANQVSAGAGQVSSGVGQVKKGSGQLKSGANEVKKGASTVDKAAGQVKAGSNKVKKGSNKVKKGSEELETAVDPSLIPDGPVKKYAEGNSELAKGSSSLADGSVELANGSVQLAEGSVQLANGSSKVAGGASDLADGSVELAEGSLSLAAGAELLGTSAAGALFAAAGALGASANQLSAITGVNESLIGDYFFSPVKLDRQEMFSVPDYGSNVSPFYLVLSMWVGALITCVMMEPKSSAGTKYTPFEMYFGKLMIYIIMSILQASVTLVGAQILGIYITNYPLFIFSAILVSVIFMILIYSIISAIGTVGKGLIVILLVFQISSTGGLYPIQIMHKFFQFLYPYMPMTYGIKLVREAQLGVVWSNYIPALIILLTIGIVTVIVGILIKSKADKPSKYFEERLEESGLF
ncbi:YhgE/Pip family protein [Methanobrevibacter sp.]